MGYTSCFIASHAIDWMVSNNLVKSRDEAITKGNEMIRLNMLQHITDANKPFEDKETLFRFIGNKWINNPQQNDVSSNIKKNGNKNEPSADNTPLLQVPNTSDKQKGR